MIKVTSSIHNHCTHCDGAHSAWEMAESAYKAGFTDFGFSSHSLIECTPASWAMQDEAPYKAEINEIKKAYAGKMRVYCGLEVDYYSLPRQDRGFDYLIDSVHKLYKDGKYYSVDSSRELFEELLNVGYGGDGYKASKDYYDTVCRMIEEKNPKVICHIDLVTKFNDGMRYFDEANPKYIAQLYQALDFALEKGAIIEINYGAIARGCKSTPYPAQYTLSYLKDKKARLLIGADCHNKHKINFGFDEGVKLLSENGFKTVTVFQNGEYIDIPLK